METKKEPPSELVIMGRLERMLESLDAAARQRVLAWLIAKHDHRQPADRQECRAVGLTPLKSNDPMPF